MAKVLFQDGKKIGEVRDWRVEDQPAEVRNVLGKEILMKKPNDLCHFISPKPVDRKKKLTIIYDGTSEWVLAQPKLDKSGTIVAATVVEKRTI